MAGITGAGTISNIDLYTSDTTVYGGRYIGQRIRGNENKEFIYVKAGASNLVVGNLIQSPAISTQFDDMVVPAAVAVPTQGSGPFNVTVTNGTVTTTTDQFAGGTLVVDNGEEYTIIGNNIATSGQPLTITLDRPIRTAWTTSDTVTIRNLYNSVIQAPTTLTGVVLGVAIYAIPASSYGWIQVKGTVGALSDASTGAVGSALSNSASTAGAVGVFVAGTGRAFVGHATRALSSAKLVPIQLDL